MSKALAAMSGGVDSAVTAHLLLQQGYDTAGTYLRLFGGEGCGSEKEAKAAEEVAAVLGIPFEVKDCREEFRAAVMEEFVRAYEAAETPNPCICCNSRVKFPVIGAIAEREGYDIIATGHYARISYDSGSGRTLLKRAADRTKDQSYVLYGLQQDILSRTVFPLGELTKSEVRAVAAGLSLPNAGKKDSQDICFVPDGDYAAFIERFTKKHYPPGEFVSTDGTRLGTHQGIIRYTVGQRKGLGLALPHPMYVLQKDTENNRVILCDAQQLYTRTVRAKNINLIPVERIAGSLSVTAKIRYGQKEQKATVSQEDEDTLLLTFDEPVRAAAKGQSVVLYDGEYVLGGGTIV